jgi:hypothetical protein
MKSIENIKDPRIKLTNKGWVCMFCNAGQVCKVVGNGVSGYSTSVVYEDHKYDCLWNNIQEFKHLS